MTYHTINKYSSSSSSSSPAGVAETVAAYCQVRETAKYEGGCHDLPYNKIIFQQYVAAAVRYKEQQQYQIVGAARL